VRLIHSDASSTQLHSDVESNVGVSLRSRRPRIGFAVETTHMQHTEPAYLALFCVVLVASLGLGLLLPQRGQSSLWWQAKVEQQMARIAAITLVLLGGVLVIMA
jgi:hypothetical protein